MNNGAKGERAESQCLRPVRLFLTVRTAGIM
jgi:hypothetical protein